MIILAPEKRTQVEVAEARLQAQFRAQRAAMVRRLAKQLHLTEGQVIQVLKEQREREANRERA